MRPGKKHWDFLVIGGGISGLAIARELRLRDAGSVLVAEKETSLARHASGRNSGVLHAGIYYAEDSLKARFCAEGSRKMQAYAAKRGVRVRKTGKVIVATRPQAEDWVEALAERASKNGVRFRRLTEAGLRTLEPEAATHKVALHSPDTAVVDSKGILLSLAEDLEGAGAEVRLGSEVVRIEPGEGTAFFGDGSECSYGHLINAAGLHADRVAWPFGVGRSFKMLPFKGVYRSLSKGIAGRLRSAIYPAPDPRMPFLGVHLTPDVSGGFSVGPTAIPALGRENYGWLDGLSPLETPRILLDVVAMLAGNVDGLRSMAAEELSRYRKKNLVAAAKELVPALAQDDLGDVSKVGLRAQLVDAKTRKFVMDFVVENAENSTHVLNAVSPGFTSALSFAEYVVDRATNPERS